MVIHHLEVVYFCNIGSMKIAINVRKAVKGKDDVHEWKTNRELL